MNQPAPVITRLYEVICEMKAHAINNDWEQVESADLSRKEILDELVKSTIPLSPADQETMKRILQLDQDILELARTERQNAASALQGLSKQQTGCNTYQQNQYAK